MIDAGAAGVHFEDQLSSEKKCGHLGGKVLIPTGQHIKTLNAARLAADVLRRAVAGDRADRRARGHAADVGRGRAGPAVHDRGADRRGVLPGARRDSSRAWPAGSPSRRTPTCCGWRPRRRTSTRRASSPRRSTPVYPDQLLAYNCSPSFNWRAHLDDATIAKFQKELAAMGYRFQFITLAGFHALNESMFELAARVRARRTCRPTSGCRRREFGLEPLGYTATRHQREAGHRVLRPGHPGDRAGRRDHRAGRVDRGVAVRRRLSPRCRLRT